MSFTKGHPSGETEASEVARASERRRVLVSSYLGSAIEFYDFLLYGTAASLVFGQLFFADLDPVTALIASFGTLAVGYLARPLGGVIFGHFGDRLGRKRMLVITMGMMGAASFLVGVLPGQAQIGAAAPVLLVVLRTIQGIAVGGEWGGATLMALEHSTAQRRGFSASIVNAGAPTGATLAALMVGIFSLLPDQEFLAWGWRVPFLLSAVLVGISLWIRLRINESPVFVAAQKTFAAKKAASPLVSVLQHPQAVVLACLGGLGAMVIQSLMATFALTFAVLGGTDRSTVLGVAAVSSVVNIVTIPIFGGLSDRVGRRPVLLAGFGTAAVLIYPTLRLIGSGDLPLVVLGYLIGYGLLVGCLFGVLSAFISEKFPTSSRYTGSSLGYQLSSTIGAGFAPMIAASLLASAGGEDPIYVAIFAGSACLVSLVAVALSRESCRTDLRSEPTTVTA